MDELGTAGPECAAYTLVRVYLLIDTVVVVVASANKRQRQLCYLYGIACILIFFA